MLTDQQIKDYKEWEEMVRIKEFTRLLIHNLIPLMKSGSFPTINRLQVDDNKSEGNKDATNPTI